MLYLLEAVSQRVTPLLTRQEYYDIIIMVMALAKALIRMVATWGESIDMRIPGSVCHVILHGVVPMLYSISILSVYLS